MAKEFQAWHTVKEKLHTKTKKNIIPKEREVYWASVGVNIGHEQDGKGNIFSRPVLIVKKYNNHLFFGIPLSTQIKQGSFFFEFELNGKKSNALIVQGRIYDTKRLENRIGMISINNFCNLKLKFKKLLDM
ncbi:MAG: type II toxin-antitoxin system PemK/MazF family toxin [Sulfurovum sp.]